MVALFAYTGIAFVTGIASGVASDLICQCIEIRARYRRSEKVSQDKAPPGFVATHAHDSVVVLESVTFDRVRLVRFTGLVVANNVLFQMYLNRIQSEIPEKTIEGVVRKVFITEFVFSPFFYALFLAINTTLHDQTCADVPRVIKKELFPIVVMNTAVYAPFDILRFYIIPAAWQTPTGNCVDVCFNVYLTYRANSSAFEGERITKARVEKDGSLSQRDSHADEEPMGQENAEIGTEERKGI